MADDDEPGGKGQAGRRTTSTAEKAVIAFSVALTLLLFAYAGWQILAPQQANTPEVRVVETATLESGDVAVTVELRNPTDVGFVTATVESSCTSPPAQVEFSYVPASSTRTGTLVCPEGTTDPSVSLENWVSI